MKRNYTFLMAAFMLLVMFAIPMGMKGQTTTTVTDQMTHADLAATGSSYTDFSGVTIESDAVYAGNSAREYANSQYNIQLRSRNSNSGIVTTTSGGNIVSITITVAHGTNTIDIYGKNTAYSSASDLYNANTQGTKIGSLSATGTINVTGSYAYVGIRSNNNAVYLSSIDFVWEVGGSAAATTTTIDASNLTNTDVYVSTTAGSLTASVTETESGDAISGATVVWSSSDTDVATIDSNGAVTLVAAGTTTITASYAGESDVYAISSATYELTVTNSAPYVQPTTIDIIPNYTFWGQTGQFSGDANDELEGSKDNVTLNWTRGNGSTYANTTAMRFYKDNNLTFTAPEGYVILSIQLTVSGTYSDLSFSPTGFDNETTTWTGAAETVTMSRPSSVSSYATISKFTITLGLPSTDPSITANDVNITYDATSGEIEYTLTNPATNGNLSVSENVDWISNAVVNASENKVTFTTTANEATTAREGVITLTYTYGDNETVTKDVTVTQAAAPLIYTTIPALFEAATSTETNVLVTFNNWVVSGVSTNGKNVFVTDNDGNGFVIYYSEDMSNTYAVGDILSGTAVSCSLKKYNGFAELLNVNATDLTITTGGNVTEANVAMANLAGVNTGALVHYENLTCSVNNNKYYLTDGTTTIQVYNSLFAFDALEDGETYNISGIYQQYNNTKEILPRSADDIELVEVQHEEYTLTVSNLINVNTFLFAGDESEMILEGEGSVMIYDGTEVMISVDAEAGYIIESLMVNGEEHVADIDGGMYIFTMPTNDVTVSATAAIPTGDQYVLYTGELVEGDYLIVYDDGAMNTTVTNDRLQYENVTVNNDVIVTDNAEIVWHIAPSGEYWTIYNADADAYAASTGAKNKAQMLDDGTDDKALWSVSGTETYEFVNKANSENNVNANLRKNGTYGFACYATGTGGALSLYKKVESTPTYTLTIDGYNNGDKGGYYLIASPVTVDPSTIEGMTVNPFDLYYFDESKEDEWRNYEANTFNLVPGKGYLYAKQASTVGETFSFELSGTAYNGAPIILQKTDNAQFEGWNLVGNPLNEAIYIDRDFYVMNEGLELIQGSGAIEPMQGFFVTADTDEEELSFSTTAPSQNDKKIVISVSNGKRSVIDRATVRFDQGRQLPKFMLNDDNTKLYIPDGNEEYAVVRRTKSGNLPVNFEPAEDGEYNINVNPESLKVTYLHLIDNKENVDIDLLSMPTYRFKAEANEKPNRFELIYKTGQSSYKEVKPRGGKNDFSFYNNGNLIIENEGESTLQVIDINGRILSNEKINGSHSKNIDAVPGIYTIRLINSNDVMTQKIVVK